MAVACVMVRDAAARRSISSASAPTRPRRAASTSQRAERLALVSASLATGAAVSLGRPVAFVGLVVPHLVRLIVGADHRLVLPASALFGAAFLIACDLVARTLFAPLELPVGIVTAIIGGPFFLWLLVRRRREASMMKRLLLILRGRMRLRSAPRRIAVPAPRSSRSSRRPPR